MLYYGHPVIGVSTLTGFFYVNAQSVCFIAQRIFNQRIVKSYFSCDKVKNIESMV